MARRCAFVPLRTATRHTGSSLVAMLGLWACSGPTAATEAPPPRPRALAPTERTVPAPAPSPTGAPVAPAVAPPPRDPGRANIDPDDDGVVGPPEAISDCETRLSAAGVETRAGSLPLRKQPAGHFCGAEQAVIYQKGPGGVAWNAPPVVTCAMALGLARFENILQEEAERLLGARVTRIVQGGTYSCRKMARFRLVSEHSYGNAIDIKSFTLSDGRTLSVKKDFGALGAEPSNPGSQFLRKLAHRAYDEEVFSVVLTPYWDALHADHFHFDQARYRVDGGRPQSGE